MNWLLDTHVVVWSELDPARLGPSTVELLQRPGELLHVATISTLEVARLQEGGQLHLLLSAEAWMQAALKELGAVTLELSHAVAAEAYALPPTFHRDPCDRMLVATARRHDLELITADQRILDYPHVRSWDARR